MAKKAPKKATEYVFARVLSRCHLGDVNELVKLRAHEAKIFSERGMIDTHESAVKAAKNVGD